MTRPRGGSPGMSPRRGDVSLAWAASGPTEPLRPIGLIQSGLVKGRLFVGIWSARRGRVGARRRQDFDPRPVLVDPPIPNIDGDAERMRELAGGVAGLWRGHPFRSLGIK